MTGRSPANTPEVTSHTLAADSLRRPVSGAPFGLQSNNDLIRYPGTTNTFVAEGEWLKLTSLPRADLASAPLLLHLVELTPHTFKSLDEVVILPIRSQLYLLTLNGCEYIVLLLGH